MKKSIFTIKTNFLKILILSFSLIFISAGTVLANGINPQLFTTQSQNSNSENPIFQKQKEIDKYVFEEHAKEIAQKGFTVTHTSPLDSYVEVGISPYNKENADYLYKIFGNDKVKVVEGQKAQLMNGAVATTAAVDKTEPASKTNPLLYGAAIIVVLGAISFIGYKRKLTK